MNWKKCVVVGTSALLLTACHHDNPLKTNPAKIAATFLMNASANVEMRLHFVMRKGDRGYGYLECMEGKKNKEIDCKALYSGIVNFAHEDHYPAFSKLTLADLNDTQAFAKLSDDYYEVLVSTWPTYYKKGHA